MLATQERETLRAFDSVFLMIRLGKYRHFKGGEYEVIAIAKHSETQEDFVVYRALYGEGLTWIRPASMWEETITRDGKTFARFTFIEEMQGAGTR